MKKTLLLVSFIAVQSFCIDINKSIGFYYFQFSNASICGDKLTNIPNIGFNYQIYLLKLIQIKNEIEFGWKNIGKNNQTIDSMFYIYTSDFNKVVDYLSIGLLIFNKNKSLGLSITPSIGITYASCIYKFEFNQKDFNFSRNNWGVGINGKIDMASYVNLTNNLFLFIGFEFLSNNIDIDNFNIKYSENTFKNLGFSYQIDKFKNEGLGFKIGLDYIL